MQFPVPQIPIRLRKPRAPYGFGDSFPQALVGAVKTLANFLCFGTMGSMSQGLLPRFRNTYNKAKAYLA